MKFPALHRSLNRLYQTNMPHRSLTYSEAQKLNRHQTNEVPRLYAKQTIPNKHTAPNTRYNYNKQSKLHIFSRRQKKYEVPALR